MNRLPRLRPAVPPMSYADAASLETKPRIPHYYLNNFFAMVDEVLTHNAYLLEPPEIKMVHDFRERTSEHSQRLFIRIFNRKGPWFRIRYVQGGGGPGQYCATPNMRYLGRNTPCHKATIGCRNP